MPYAQYTIIIGMASFILLSLSHTVLGDYLLILCWIQNNGIIPMEFDQMVMVMVRPII